MPDLTRFTGCFPNGYGVCLFGYNGHMVETKGGDTVGREWSEWVRSRFKESGVRSISAFAQQLRVPHQTVFGWMEHGRQPTMSLALRVAHALNLPDDEVLRAAGLIGEEPDPDEPPAAREWRDFGQQLETDGDDKEIVLAAVAALATLPGELRGVMRAYLRTAAGQVLQAAALHRAGATMDWANIAPPPETSGD